MLRRNTLIIAFLSLLFAVDAVAQDASSFKISEVMVANEDGLVDEYSNRSPWIEIANTSWGTVNLQSCYLTNNRKAIEDMPVPERVKLMSLISKGDLRTKLQAQQRIIFFADGRTNLGTLHTSFRLIPGQENFIALFDGNARTLLDSVTIPACVPVGHSYARFLTKDMKNHVWRILPPKDVTPGSANNLGKMNEDKVAEFKERDPHGFGMSVLGMGIVFSCLLSLYLFFRLFGIVFNKRNQRKEQMAVGPEEDNVDDKAAMKDQEIYMAVIAMALSKTLNRHDDESGVITIRPHRSNWNPKANF